MALIAESEVTDIMLLPGELIKKCCHCTLNLKKDSEGSNCPFSQGQQKWDFAIYMGKIVDNFTIISFFPWIHSVSFSLFYFCCWIEQ